MTIETKEIIVRMLRNDGIYPGAPQASSIYSYDSDYGKKVFAVFMDEQFNDIDSSPYVHNPVLLWTRVSGLTDEGKTLIES